MLVYLTTGISSNFQTKNTSSEDFEDIYNVFLGGIGYNINSLVQTGKYGAMKKTYPITM